MSERLSPDEFSKRQRDWIAAYEPASAWDRRDTLNALLQAFRRLSYFEVTKSGVTTLLVPMVEVRGRFSVVRRIAELVQLDIETIVRDATPPGAKTVTSVANSPDGFTFRVCLVEAGVATSLQIQAESLR